MMTFLLPLMTWAALLTGSPGDKTLELDWQNQKSKLELVGKGLRAKKVVFVSVKVYDAFFYVDQPAAFQRTSDGALSSLSGQKKLAMVLKFRRSVEASQVLASFKEAFKTNEISTEAPGIKEFLSAVSVGGGANEGKTLTLVGIKDESGETLIYENAKGAAATVKGTTGFIQQVMSIWFGKMGESTMTDLKTSLLKAP